ncbi:hypothetical protein JYG23_11755 [Sedimentibacter sp. zth1]|uniref:hypothetical protein n=1 Tax=Sedimentibacter sp. zth1 TaxID=2816908 RepID=UPI001A936B14|nr:hypothetical protein [Sedimentibacter sp. zth1]QSX05344.1 hypothetical protein JYG23_11755 [Sedimentibacter sp. zth1]
MKNFAYYSKWALRIGIGIAFIYSLIIRNWIGIAGGLAIFLSTYIIDYINRNRKVISDDLVSLYSIFCIFAVVIGVMFNFYDVISWWDLLMHVFSGIILAIVGNSLLNSLLKGKKTNPTIRFFFLLGFACIGGVVWEIYEFAVDNILSIDTQRVATTLVNDTMSDLITDVMGGLLASIYFAAFDKRGI